MASELACPKCQSEDTQKISVIIEHGTTEIETETRSTGVGFGSRGSVGFGVGKSSTSGVAQTTLAKKFSEELNTPASILQGIIGAILLVASIYVGIKVGGFFSSSFIGWSSGIVLFLAAAYFASTTILKPSDAAIALEKRKELWKESGCYCNRCGNPFIPGSNEVYNFSE